MRKKRGQTRVCEELCLSGARGSGGGDSELEVVFSKYSLSCRDGEIKHGRHFACLLTPY